MLETAANPNVSTKIPDPALEMKRPAPDREDHNPATSPWVAGESGYPARLASCRASTTPETCCPPIPAPFSQRATTRRVTESWISIPRKVPPPEKKVRGQLFTSVPNLPTRKKEAATRMELTPEGTGYAVGTVLETKEETNVDWAEFKMPQYLRLEVD